MTYTIIIFISLIALSLFLKKYNGEKYVVTTSDIVFAAIPAAIVLFYSPNLKTFSFKDGSFSIERTVGDVIRDIQIAKLGGIMKKVESHAASSVLRTFKNGLPEDHCFAMDWDDVKNESICRDGAFEAAFKTLSPVGEEVFNYLISEKDKERIFSSDKALSITFVDGSNPDVARLANMFAFLSENGGDKSRYLTFHDEDLSTIAVCNFYVMYDWQSDDGQYNYLRIADEFYKNSKISLEMRLFLQTSDIDSDDCYFEGSFLSTDSTILDAIRIFSASELITKIPIVNKEGNVVGEVVREDIVARSLIDLMTSLDSES